MSENLNNNLNAKILLVFMIIVGLITGCSSEKSPSQQSQEKPNSGLSSSGNLSAELPKQDSSEKVSGAAVVKEQPAPVEEALPKAALSNPAPAEPLAAKEQTSPAEIMPVSPAVAVEPQNQPAPAVDLSLAVEPRVGSRAPDFSLQTLDGAPIQLASLIGKPVLINYWATWCVPCKTEMPILQKLYQEYQQKGIVFLSVNAFDQDSLEKVQAAVSEYNMSYPVLLDQDRQFADTYEAIFFPTTVLVDASGVIREVSLGDSTEAELRSSLDKLLMGSF